MSRHRHFMLETKPSPLWVIVNLDLPENDFIKECKPYLKLTLERWDYSSRPSGEPFSYKRQYASIPAEWLDASGNIKKELDLDGFIANCKLTHDWFEPYYDYEAPDSGEFGGHNLKWIVSNIQIMG